MRKGGTGGSETARAGSNFEVITDERFIEGMFNLGYELVNLHKLSGQNGPVHGRTLVNTHGEKVEVFYKSGLYKLFFEPLGVNYKEYFSARLEPDTALYSHKTNTLTIIEKKQMVAAGSVAEKLQTCDYKRYYYEKLLEAHKINLEITWVLGSYFKEHESQLKSVYEYMLSKGSKYYYGEIPLDSLHI